MAAHSTSPYLDANWDEKRNGQRANYSGIKRTPERTGSPPDGPSPQRHEVLSHDELEMEDQSFAAKRRVGDSDLGVMVTITYRRIARAGRYPLLG